MLKFRLTQKNGTKLQTLCNIAKNQHIYYSKVVFFEHIEYICRDKREITNYGKLHSI